MKRLRESVLKGGNRSSWSARRPARAEMFIDLADITTARREVPNRTCFMSKARPKAY